ncbi:hypothetical protein BC332_24121 [Capsicum chinense]|nr:hypothetical protein BC332_24121 [Capsicum chinense]
MITTTDALDNTQGPICNIGNNNNDANPLAMGAGHINPNKALDPGLLYDVTPEDYYINLLCALDFTSKQIKAITRFLGAMQHHHFSKLWQKLGKVKIVVKQLRTNEFSNIEEKLNEARRNLVHMQDLIADGGHPELLETIKEANKTYEKWARTEESVVRQKSRTQWLRLGDVISMIEKLCRSLLWTGGDRDGKKEMMA